MNKPIAVHRMILPCIVLAMLAVAGCAASGQTSEGGSGRDSANVITAEEIAAYTGHSLSELIITEVAGVTRSRDGSLIIRGSTSFQGGTEPLYVLDGVPLSAEPVVNIKDIEEIEVLKGTDSSMYGTRGANGVILITTKT